MFIYGYLYDVDDVDSIDFCEVGWICTPADFCGDGLRVLRVAAVCCTTSSTAASVRHPMSTFLYRTLCLCSGLLFFCAIFDYITPRLLPFAVRTTATIPMLLPWVSQDAHVNVFFWLMLPFFLWAAILGTNLGFTPDAFASSAVPCPSTQISHHRQLRFSPPWGFALHWHSSSSATMDMCTLPELFNSN